MNYVAKPAFQMIDSHIHLDRYPLQMQQQLLDDVARKTYGIASLITVSMDVASCVANMHIAEQFDFVYPAFGYHPEQALPSDEDIAQLLSFIRKQASKMVAIGEVGLPYYLKRDQPNVAYEPYVQFLELMIQEAKMLGKPIILHAVYEDACSALQLLERHSIPNAHFHWFKGDNQSIERIIENRYCISITPDVVYEQEIQRVVKSVPLELLFIETDGPWPFEGQFANEHTHPKMMQLAIQKIAELKRLPAKEVAIQLYNNTCQFYRLKE